jgi:hypothetical protein
MDTLGLLVRPISKLRRRMLEDMAVCKFGEKTRHDWLLISAIRRERCASSPSSDPARN